MLQYYDSILNIKSVIARTTFSRASIYRLISLGKFPPQRKIAARRSGWLESEIQSFIVGTFHTTPTPVITKRGRGRPRKIAIESGV